MHTIRILKVNFENKRISQLQSSPSMKVALRAKELAASGKEIIDLSLGEPDFKTPQYVLDAVVKTIETEQAHYGAPTGDMELKQAIVAKLLRENGLTYQTDEIIVGNGAKQILYHVLMATLESGDEVIVPAPYWVSYTDMVQLHGGTSIVIPCGSDAGFKLNAEQLEKAITPKTKWLMLNSPSNPSGAIYSKEELTALGRVLEKHPQVLVISDEIYEHILLTDDHPFVSFVEANPALKDRTILINGVSKAYAMTGWRVGYGVAHKDLIKAVSKLQSQSVTSVATASQKAATAALNGPQDFVKEAAKEYRARAELFVGGLQNIAGIEVAMPQGAFYAYPNCTQLMGKVTPSGQVIENDQMLASYLLEEGGVSCVPGAAFGLSPYLRFSFATTRAQLVKALEKIQQAVAALK